MKPEKFSQALEKISDKYIEEACEYQSKPKARPTAVRKWLAFAACVVLIAALFPVGIIIQNGGWNNGVGTGPITTANTEESDPFAESTSHDQPYIPIESTPGLEYSVHSDGKTCTITGIGDCEYKDEIVVGDTIDGYRVVGIADKALGEVKHSNGIEGWISNPHFTKITIGKSVTSIASNAFCDKKIKEVYYTGDIEDWCKISFGDYYANPMWGGAKLYFNNELVTDIVIPGSITEIGQNQFEGCSSLKSVVISEGVKSIGPNAFAGCSSLKSVVIPEGVESIGSSAFSSCWNLESVSLPSTVNTIGSSAFESCQSISSIVIPDGVTIISYALFKNCHSLKSITLPNSVKTIAAYAFYSCASLESITLPDSLTELGDYALCCAVDEIMIPKGIESIGKKPFSTITYHIYYAGTIAEWKAIPKEDDWGKGINSHSIKCTDGFYWAQKTPEDGNPEE